MSADEMLAMCRSQLGYRERSDGSTRYGDWFAKDHGAVYRTGDWCAMGLLWCAWKTGLLDAVGGSRKEWAWVPSWAGWFRNTGRWAKHPERGAIVFFDFNHSGEPDHVGIVTRPGDSQIQTIEFNTGNACKQRTRQRSDVLGYGHPYYTADDETVIVVSLGA